MAGNTVTLTFAGDSSRLESAFGEVGEAARTMGTDVAAAGAGFDRVGEAADNVDTRAMGFRDTLTGLQDGMEGVKVAQDGIGFESLLLMGFAVGDLASGLYNFLIPSLKAGVTWLKSTRLATIASEVATRTAAVASRTWAAGQWLLNAALTANPIGLVVVAVGLLVAAVVLIATKTDWFQKAWEWTWSKIGDPVKAAWAWIKKVGSNALDFYLGMPGRIWGAFKKLGGWISAPFREAFNFVARAWNGTVGQLRWTVPGWVPVIGGATVAAPQLPQFHAGGVVPGPVGAEVLAVLRAGETVTRAGRAAGPGVLEVRGDGTQLANALVEILARAVRVRGGDVQLVLGGGRV